MNNLRVSTDEEPQRRVTKSQQRWSMGTRKLRTLGKLFATQEVPEEDSKEYVPIEGTSENFETIYFQSKILS